MIPDDSLLKYCIGRQSTWLYILFLVSLTSFIPADLIKYACPKLMAPLTMKITKIPTGIYFICSYCFATKTLSIVHWTARGIAAVKPETIRLRTIPPKTLGQYGFVSSAIFLRICIFIVYPTYKL